MLDRTLLGKTYPPIIFDVEKQRLRFFSKATGQTDPVYFDELAAQAKGYRSILAAPTFLTTVGMAQADPFPHVADLKLNMARLLYASQHFTYHEAICAGDTITLVSEITDMFDKNQGELQFCVITQTCSNQQGALVATLLGTLVVK